jgi:hypothetical protein
LSGFFYGGNEACQGFRFMHRKVRFIRRSRASYFAALPQNAS